MDLFEIGLRLSVIGFGLLVIVAAFLFGVIAYRLIKDI